MDTPPPPCPPPNTCGNPDSLSQKEILDYAWKWFQYHASQRLLAFNFLLVLMGALSVAYYKACELGRNGQAAIVALFGVIVALAFFILEIRNEQLVNVGRKALLRIEELPPFSLLPECQVMTEDRRRSKFMSHAFWLRTIELTLLVIFVFALLSSLLKMLFWES